MKTIIIDYGLGNLRSIEKALQYVGADVEISNEPQAIDSADALILLGVGAFRYAMMHFSTLERVVKDAVNEGKPLLGICLGMQMLASESEEGGLHNSSLSINYMNWMKMIRRLLRSFD